MCIRTKSAIINFFLSQKEIVDTINNTEADEIENEDASKFEKLFKKLGTDYLKKETKTPLPHRKLAPSLNGTTKKVGQKRKSSTSQTRAPCTTNKKELKSKHRSNTHTNLVEVIEISDDDDTSPQPPLSVVTTPLHNGSPNAVLRKHPDVVPVQFTSPQPGPSHSNYSEISFAYTSSSTVRTPPRNISPNAVPRQYYSAVRVQATPSQPGPSNINWSKISHPCTSSSTVRTPPRNISPNAVPRQNYSAVRVQATSPQPGPSNINWSEISYPSQPSPSTVKTPPRNISPNAVPRKNYSAVCVQATSPQPGPSNTNCSEVSKAQR